MLAAGLYGALRISQDENNGLFFSLSYAMSLPCRLACLAAPLSLAALSFLLALILSGTAGTMGTELPALVLYVLAVGGFSWLLKCVCPSSQVLCCIIPFWIAGSLIFCPVFADISRYLPLAGALGRIFLPGYYLRLF